MTSLQQLKHQPPKHVLQSMYQLYYNTTVIDFPPSVGKQNALLPQLYFRSSDLPYPNSYYKLSQILIRIQSKYIFCVRAIKKSPQQIHATET